MPVRSDPLPRYLAAFVVLGLASSLLGPAVSQLRQQTGSTVGGIAIAFTAQSLGYLAASLAAGRWFDAGGGHRLLAGGIAVMGLAAIGLPLAGSVAAVCAVIAVVGAGAAIVDVGGNTLLVWSRHGEPGSALNALHLAFGLGALASPLVVGRSVAWGDDLWPAVGLVALVAVGLAATLRATPAPPHPHAAAPAEAPPADRRAYAGLAVFFLLYVGVELGFAGWVHTYAEDIDLGGPAAATGLTATFWAAFCLGRLTAIGLVRVVGETALLLGSCGLAVAAAAALVAGDGAPAVVWPATAVFGLGVAPQFPTMLAVADRHLGLTGEATSWVIAGAAIGSLTLPWFIGTQLDARGAHAMPVAVLVAAAAATAWCGALVWGLAARRPVPTPTAA